jgi:hypothetical protein
VDILRNIKGGSCKSGTLAIAGHPERVKTNKQTNKQTNLVFRGHFNVDYPNPDVLAIPKMPLH